MVPAWNGFPQVGMPKGRCWGKTREFSWRCGYKAHLIPALDALTAKNNSAFITWPTSPFLTVELDTGLIQLSLRSVKKAPSRIGSHSLWGSRSLRGCCHSVKGFKDPCTHEESVSYSVLPCPCSGNVSLSFRCVSHLDSCTFLRHGNASYKERVHCC